jgi:hypothetical protein
MLGIIILISSLIIAGMLHRIANAFEDQNDIQKEQNKLAKDLFIETKGNRITNEKARILNEEYLTLVLLEKKASFGVVGKVEVVNDQITDAVTQGNKPVKATKTTKTTKTK